MQTYEHYFTGRRPSKDQIVKRLLAAVGAGYKDIEISWGENMLGFHYMDGDWYGFGWIKTIGGDDIVRELQRKFIL